MILVIFLAFLETYNIFRRVCRGHGNGGGFLLDPDRQDFPVVQIPGQVVFRCYFEGRGGRAGEQYVADFEGVVAGHSGDEPVDVPMEPGAVPAHGGLAVAVQGEGVGGGGVVRFFDPVAQGDRSVEAFGDVDGLALSGEAVVEVLGGEVDGGSQCIVVFVGEACVDVFAQSADAYGQFGFGGDAAGKFGQEERLPLCRGLESGLRKMVGSVGAGAPFWG